MSEFDLIRTFFGGVGARRTDVLLGIGDDCALLRAPAGTDLAVSIDTLVSGVHFFTDCDPERLGHKCLAVGLSDLASMGADPAWATLALTLPRAEEAWLRAFSAGFSSLAREHGVELIGGDTTQGPLSITVQVHGLLPAGKGIRRSGARPGDLVCVSGTIGDAGLALSRLRAGEAVSSRLRERLERPTPRVAAGRALRRLATAMIDVSDGLVADLRHILEASCVGAELRLEDLPLTPELKGHLSSTRDWSLPLSAGDDYELCFTLPASSAVQLEPLAERLDCPLTAIGRVDSGIGLRCLTPEGATWTPVRAGYDHFC